MKRLFALALFVLIAVRVFAQTDATTSQPRPALEPVRSNPVHSDIQELKDAIAAQQQQIHQLQQQTQQLREQVRTRDSAIQQLETRVGRAESAPDRAHAEAMTAAAAQSPTSADELAVCNMMSPI